MTFFLDHSLDEILAMRTRAIRRSGNKAAFVGGFRKRPQRAATKMASPSSSSSKVGSCKIIVSNLPYDVTEKMIEEYFQFVAGPIRRATLIYGPDGRSHGVATVEFTKPERAALVARKYDGLKVDNRPMKVELVIGADVADRICGPDKIRRAPVQMNMAIQKSSVKPAFGRGRGGACGENRGGNGGSGPGRARVTEDIDEGLAACFGGLGI